MAVPPQPQPAPEELLARVQELSERVQRLEDPGARDVAFEFVSAVITMYGDGLERILAAIRASRDAGATILDELSQDGAVASLLLIHDLYPVGLRERVLEALDTVRPYMESHGGDVELLQVTEEGVARLALQGSCNGCSASRATLETAIVQALTEHCPDLAGIDVEGVVAQSGPASAVTGMALPMADPISLPVLQSTPSTKPSTTSTTSPATSTATAARWTEVDDAQRPPRDTVTTVGIAGRSVMLADVGGTLLAYEDECAACGETLHDGSLHDGLLGCAHCGAGFDLPRAGRAAGGEPLQLHPLPLLEVGGLRVAV
jgi:Fe-S cluster biogenesis protein NfuA/nitrite reductase/ring-hydroxylating ferredoxin subunit